MQIIQNEASHVKPFSSSSSSYPCPISNFRYRKLYNKMSRKEEKDYNYIPDLQSHMETGVISSVGGNALQSNKVTHYCNQITFVCKAVM